MERITVLLEPEVYADVLAQAKEESRSKSKMVALLVKRGLDLPLAVAGLNFAAGTLQEVLEEKK